jgi:4-methyl-5(b-hydroxyethyl)-thiazole monophosphate biosynthesis
MIFMKTLALLYPGCIEFEILLACEILNHKFPVEVVTPDGKNHLGSNGMNIVAHKSLKDVDPRDYKVALVPGGDPGVMIGSDELNQVLTKMNSQGSILGAICAGPVLLEQARLLDGLKVSHGYAGPQKEWLLEKGFFKQTELCDEAISINGNIVTSRPDSFIDFAVEIASLAGALEPHRKTFWKEYYRGLPGTPR